MSLLVKHGPRIGVTLIPLLMALLHAIGLLPLGLLQQLDNAIYDTRMRVTMPKVLDDRVVVVDIDEKSLAEVGHWPWSRHRVAQLLDILFDEHKVALAGFDIVFAEPDESSGLKRLQELMQNELKDQPGFSQRVQQLAPSLDYDGLLAKALQGRPIVLGYYLTSDREGRSAGVLPQPVLGPASLQGRPIKFTKWNGYGSNLPDLAKAAPTAGFFNSISDEDGVVRSVPLLAEYQGQYYESLSLAMYRVIQGRPDVVPGFPQERFLFDRSYHGLDSILLQGSAHVQSIPVDDRVAVLVPFRGSGGVHGGAFRYVSASDILARRIPPESLRDRIILVGTTAPGLLDLRVTPVGAAYPGVEMHANLISSLLDGKLLVAPDFSVGFDVLVLLIVGLFLAFVLPLVSAPLAVLISAMALSLLIVLNYALYKGPGWVMPLGASLSMVVTAFALNMSYGYFVESRSKRMLARLFGTYVPPTLVNEMVKDPDSYSMEARNKELTVMFCDMRGFTKLSEKMEPTALQALLNDVFNRLTDIISANRGTIDKYMGDCVMAFWGAPVEQADHAALACKTALEMAQAMIAINQEHVAKGLPEVGVGIGLNTGLMCVGDMGSDVRRAYTVIGDAVNLGSRLEGLTRVYNVDIVVSEQTRKSVPELTWQELDRVRVKGKAQAVTIYTPIDTHDTTAATIQSELKLWSSFLKSYRAQDWEQAELQLFNLQRLNENKYLYKLFVERVALMQRAPKDPDWDGAINFDSK